MKPVRQRRKSSWRETHLHLKHAQQLIERAGGVHPDTYMPSLSDNEQDAWDALLGRMK